MKNRRATARGLPLRRRLKEAAEVAARLLQPDVALRQEALGRLKTLFLDCRSGSCETIPEVAKAAFAAIRAGLAHREPGIRMTAADAACLFACDGRDLVPDLAGVLRDPEAQVRIAVLSALSEYGAGNAAAAAEMAECLRRAVDSEERAAALHALMWCARAEDIDLLVDLLVTGDPSVQQGAAGALWNALDPRTSKCADEASAALRRLRRQ